MNEMIDRLARVIFAKRYPHGSIEQRIVFGGPITWDRMLEGIANGDCRPSERDDCLDLVRAEIEAMREPTEAMILAAAKAAADQHYGQDNSWDRNVSADFKGEWLAGAKFGWKAAIDAALKN